MHYQNYRRLVRRIRTRRIVRTVIEWAGDAACLAVFAYLVWVCLNGPGY
jgi:hypothetical protein